MTDIPEFHEGEQLSAAALNAIRAEVMRVAAGPGMFFDSTGAYQRPMSVGYVEIGQGKLDGSLGYGAGAKQNVSIWALNDAEDAWEDTGSTQEDVYSPLIHTTEALPSGTAVVYALFPDGRRYVINAEC